MAIITKPASPSVGRAASAIAVSPKPVDLVDRERSEDAERDQHVGRARHAKREVHRRRQLARRIAQVACRERDHAEAQVGEERQRDARDDVRQRRIAAERQQVQVDVDDRHADEDGEDGEQDDDDQRLRPVDDPRADQVDPQHPEHDGRREHVVPAARGVVADEKRGGIAAERDRHHRAHDHDGREVAQPRRDSDEAAVSEPLGEVRDQAARGREAHAELDDGVAEQAGDDPGEQERQPHGGARDRTRLAEQREDARADHRADTEEGGAADGHRARTAVLSRYESGRSAPSRSDPTTTARDYDITAAAGARISLRAVPGRRPKRAMMVPLASTPSRSALATSSGFAPASIPDGSRSA